MMQSFLQRAGKRLLSAESLCELLGSGESETYETLQHHCVILV